MLDKFLSNKEVIDELLVGVYGITEPSLIAMVLIGLVLIWLAVKHDMEPMLLFPMGIGCILANMPLGAAVSEHGSDTGQGFLNVLYNAGIANELFPVLVFIAIGAMCDFTPLLRRPFVMFFAGAAQFGIFVTAILAAAIGFQFNEAAAIGIIGAADGPTTIYVASRYAEHLLGPLSVAAYCYMSLVPVIQPPIIKLCTTKAERKIRMQFAEERPISPTALFIFPLVIILISSIVAPISVPLIGSLMFGNLLRVSGVTESLSQCAQNELANIVTMFLGITVGSTMTAESFLTFDVVKLLALGAVAFVFDTAGGVFFAKVLNLFLKVKVNPMIGACGISAFPMSGRVIAKMALKEDNTNYIIQHAIGVNVAGQIASVIAGGLILALIPVLSTM